MLIVIVNLYVITWTVKYFKVLCMLKGTNERNEQTKVTLRNTNGRVKYDSLSFQNVHLILSEC